MNSTVTWTNRDMVDYTVTALDGTFNPQNMPPGTVCTMTSTKPGTYVYGCEYHPLMRGKIMMKAAG